MLSVETKYSHESFKKNVYLEQGSNLSESSVYVDFVLDVQRPVASFTNMV